MGNRDLPNPNALVSRAGGKEIARGVERHRLDLIFVALQGGDLLVISVPSAPNYTRSVEAAGCQPLTTRRPAQRTNSAVMRVL
jgi:hypothetical protein